MTIKGLGEWVEDDEQKYIEKKVDEIIEKQASDLWDDLQSLLPRIEDDAPISPSEEWSATIGFVEDVTKVFDHYVCKLRQKVESIASEQTMDAFLYDPKNCICK